MIKGLLALFTSGAILNPMVLLGIFSGIAFYVSLNGDQLTVLYSDYRLYLLAVLIAFIYNFIFKKVYQSGGMDLDFSAMLLNVVASSLKLILSSVLMMSFISMISLA